MSGWRVLTEPLLRRMILVPRQFHAGDGVGARHDRRRLTSPRFVTGQMQARSRRLQWRSAKLGCRRPGAGRYRAVQRIECRKQRCRADALVVVRHCSRPSRLHRQMRYTIGRDTSTRAAMAQTVQCVTFSGGGSRNVSHIGSETFSSVSLKKRDGLILSRNEPSTPSST